MDTNIVDIQGVSVWRCFYVLSNTLATLEAQFMQKLSNTEAGMKKSVAYKKKRVHGNWTARYKKWIFICLFLEY